MNAICTKQDLWLIRAYYFVLFGALGFTFPFLNLYYARLGINAEMIGIFTTVNAIVALVVSPMVSSFSERFSKPVHIVQIGLVASGAMIALIGLTHNLVLLGLLVALNAVTFAGVYPTSISIAQMIAEHAPGNNGFGGIRLYGSLGWAIVTYFAGLAIEQYGMVVMFVGYVAFVLTGAWLLRCIHYAGEFHANGEKMQGARLGAVLSSAIKNRSLVGFALMVLISYGAMIGVRQFEVLFMDALGAQESIIGLAYTIAALVEIPFMVLADKLIDRITSTNVLRIGILLDLGRMALVALFPTIPMILVGRAISGVSYAFYTIALVKFVLERASAGQNTTLQALYNVTLPNLITIIAAPLVGSVFDHQGGYAMYTIAVAGMVLAIIVFFTTVTGRKSKPVTQAPA